MIAIEEPIGKFIALANLEQNLVVTTAIRQDVANLVDLIKVRIKDRSVQEVADTLREEVFELRIELIKWLANSNSNINDYLETLNNHISVNLQMAPYSNLAEAVSVVLMGYENIVRPAVQSLEPSTLRELNGVVNGPLEYDTFKVLALHPSPQVSYLKSWVDASLHLEIGVIVAHLVLTDQIGISKKRIKSELIDFLYRSITRFGAYSIFTRFWSPDAEDHSNLTNSMKIQAATLEMDNKSFHATSKEGLFKMINS
ncbi:MAG: hypothetical protein GVY26_08925 [Bacteroidetes bacterium]|jgi:hypothetical protein|nr:hypothetical protein [Bacteroidota bacterium]HKK79389.1 hypothetical protein [Phaeodactylibacter sp.]